MTDKIRESPYLLVIVGAFLVFVGTRAENPAAAVLFLLGVLAAAAGVALWVAKVLRG